MDTQHNAHSPTPNLSATPVSSCRPKLGDPQEGVRPVPLDRVNVQRAAKVLGVHLAERQPDPAPHLRVDQFALALAADVVAELSSPLELLLYCAGELVHVMQGHDTSRRSGG